MNVREPTHIPVLQKECMAMLAPREGQTYLDCTAGRGGHAAAVAQQLRSGTVILNDLDPANLRAAEPTVRAVAGTAIRIVPIQGNFAELPRRLVESRLVTDMVLADLGFASVHVDDPERGFSFSRPGPLDMRYDPSARTTAGDLVNSLSERDLAALIADFGEDRAARRIAQKIVAERAREPISTTDRLAHVVRMAVGGSAGPRAAGQIDPATRTFQTLRIAVNDELGSLGALLRGVERAAAEVAAGQVGWLRPGARVAVISFHSLEDRLVKRSFRALVDRGHAEDLTRRPIEATEAETAANPRARSAKLRAVRIVGATGATN